MFTVNHWNSKIGAWIPIKTLNDETPVFTTVQKAKDWLYGQFANEQDNLEIVSVNVDPGSTKRNEISEGISQYIKECEAKGETPYLD